MSTAAAASAADAIVSNFRALYERVTELERKVSELEQGEKEETTTK